MKCCDAKTFIERLNKNKTTTDREVWEMECYEKCGCPVWKEFCDTLTKVRVKRELERQSRDDPTTQE